MRPAFLFGLLCVLAVHRRAAADTPDESALGTIVVDGSAGGLAPLPKLALMPVVTSSSLDPLLQMVVRRDLELSGQFELIEERAMPPGPFLRDTPVEHKAWATSHAETVVRVLVENPNDKNPILLGEAFLIEPNAKDDGPVRAAFATRMETTQKTLRRSAHQLVDKLLGAITGRAGGFDSQLAYVARVGKWRRVMRLDADGFDLRPESPDGRTVISPTWGPGEHLFYAESLDFTSFQLAFGPQGTRLPMRVPGSVLGLAFSPDRSRLAVTAMEDGKSALWVGNRFALTKVDAAPFANRAALSSDGKVAYVGGAGAQRIYVDAKPISPTGFMASAPVFCDTPDGLLVAYTVGVGAGADIVISDPKGGGIRRLTQRQGSNTDPACSPDGRLVAFFSNAKTGKGPGLYIAPISRPFLAKKISNEVGDSLRWERRKP